MNIFPVISAIPQQWLSYITTEGMDTISFFAILPCLFDLSEKMTDDNHISTAIMNYGLLISTIALGRAVGRYYPHWQDLSHLPLLAFFMTFSLLIISISNNYLVALAMFFVKESLGSFMSEMYLTISSPGKSTPGRGRAILWTAPTTSIASMVELSVDNRMRRNLIILSFTALISCIIYNDSNDATFPAFYPCVLLMLVWNVCIFLHEILIVSHASPVMVSRSYLSRMSNPAEAAVAWDANGSNKLSLEPRITLQPSDITPQNFVDFYGNEVKARTMYIKSLEWRMQNNVDNILSIPQEHFFEILQLYPHAIHGRSRDNCVVLYEILGRTRPRDLVNTGIKMKDLLWHFNLRNEFVFQRIFDNINESFGQIMTVVDVKGINIMDISGDVFGFLIQSSNTIDSYYPQRVARIIVVNAPSWFATAFSAIAAVLPQKTRNKIRIISGFDGLEEFIASNQRPIEYGGRGYHLGQSPEHLQFLQVAESWKSMSTDSQSMLNLDTKRISKDDNDDDDNDDDNDEDDDEEDDSVIVKSSNKTQNKDRKAWSWFPIFRSSKVATPAFLGESNAFKFDPEKGAWDIDATNATSATTTESSNISKILSEDDHDDAADSSSYQLEEHKMLLALQAAQMAKLSVGQKKKSSLLSHLPSSHMNLSDDSSLVPNSIYSHYNIESSANGLFGSIGGRRPHAIATLPKLSTDVFLVTFGIYLASAIMHCFLLTLMPIWMSLPLSVGGLGYSVADIGMVCSGSAMILLVLDSYFREQMLYIIKSSPLRMIRIACGVLIVSSILIPVFLSFASTTWSFWKLFGYESHIHSQVVELDAFANQKNPLDISRDNAHVAETTDDKVNIETFRRLLESSLAISVEHGQDVSELISRQHQEILEHLSGLTPSESLSNLFNPCILLSALTCAAYLIRKASTMVLQVALAPVFTNPQIIVRSISSGVDIAVSSIAF